MRNLKKLLALVLAMVMTFSLMLSASAASGDFDKYSDKADITDTFKEAVQVLTGLDVLKGDEKGFRPAGTLTRAEAAVIVYRVATGDVTDQQTALYADYNHFADVNKDDWFAGYVGFCQNAGYIKGTTPTTFTPYGQVTGYELLAMLLRVVGYGKNNEFTGSSWQVNTAALAEQLHITDTVKEANFASTLNRGARRDVVAELTFRTMVDVPTVTYSTSMQYNDRDTLLATIKNPTLGQKIFGLFMDDTVDKIDSWGRPGYYWVKNGVQLVRSGNIATGSNVLTTSDGRVYDARTLLPEYGYKSGDATSSANASSLIATIKDEPIKVYTDKVAECDIIHDNTDWSKDTSKKVTSGYLNGRSNTALADVGGATYNSTEKTIEALGTSAIVGATGRITEIYDMTLRSARRSTANQEDGARIVEIDTYLAQVDRVYDATTDKNGHPVSAKVDLNVFADQAAVHGTKDDNESCAAGSDIWQINGVETSGFTAGQYVLVYVNQNADTSLGYKVANKKTVDPDKDDIRAAEIKAGGFVTTWINAAPGTVNPDTITVGTTVYNESDKFCCNWRVKNVPWSVAVDDYGNAIGLVNQVHYLAIEKIEWKQADTVGGGFALMDVVTGTGERIQGVKVNTLNYEKLMNTGDKAGNIDETPLPTVSDFYTNNGDYYGHIFRYSVTEDGSYDLYATFTDSAWAGHTSTSNPGDLTANLVITRGQATIDGTTASGNRNTYVATSNTVFAVLNSDGYTYTVYTGKDNVPTITGGSACVYTANGYALMVVVTGNRVVRNSEIFAGYLPSLTPYTYKNIGGTSRAGYKIYKPGEAEFTTVYDGTGNNKITGKATTTGVYRFIVNDEGEIQNDPSGPAKLPDTSNISSSLTDTNFSIEGQDLMDRVRVDATLSGTTLQTSAYNSITPNSNLRAGYSAANGTSTKAKDFNVPADTPVLKINMDSARTGTTDKTVSVGSLADLRENSVVWVYYEHTTKNAGGTGNRELYDAKAIYVLQLPTGATAHDYKIKFGTSGNAITEADVAVATNSVTISSSAGIAIFDGTTKVTNWTAATWKVKVERQLTDGNFVEVNTWSQTVGINGANNIDTRAIPVSLATGNVYRLTITLEVTNPATMGTIKLFSSPIIKSL